jgi:putative nucleotidyltransferase with HDIG domain
MAVLYTDHSGGAVRKDEGLVTELILSEREARELLARYVPLDETWGAHSVTVARLAGQIADALAAAGVTVDPALARAGGLIHDIGRDVTHDGIMHCWEGYQILLARGQPLLARFCVVHSGGGMTAEEAVSVGWPAADYRPASWEEKAVTIADGLAHYDGVVCLADRCASVRERYRDQSSPARYALIIITEGKVRAIMDEVEAIIGQPVEQLCGARRLEKG